MSLRGVSAKGAGSAGEGCARLRDLKPSVIILDVKLPDIHGFELCRKIKRMEAFKKTPVIFISASTQFNDPRDRVEGVLAGARVVSVQADHRREALVGDRRPPQVQRVIIIRRAADDESSLVLSSFSWYPSFRMAEIGVKPVEVDCPYCGETLELMVDCSVAEQDYVEDCQVCCRPMNVHVEVDDEGEPTVEASHEDDA